MDGRMLLQLNTFWVLTVLEKVAQESGSTQQISEIFYRKYLILSK